jgi:hypothetical protein
MRSEPAAGSEPGTGIRKRQAFLDFNVPEQAQAMRASHPPPSTTTAPGISPPMAR